MLLAVARFGSFIDERSAVSYLVVCFRVIITTRTIAWMSVSSGSLSDMLFVGKSRSL